MHAPHVHLVENLKQTCYRRLCRGGLLSWQTMQVLDTDVRTVSVRGVQVAETCSAEGRLQEPTLLQYHKGFRRVCSKTTFRAEFVQRWCSGAICKSFSRWRHTTATRSWSRSTSVDRCNRTASETSIGRKHWARCRRKNQSVRLTEQRRR